MDTYYPNRCVELPLRSLRTILFLMLEVYIDDTDTTVAYSGVWELSGSQSFHNSTFHVANSTVNSKATLIFTGMYLVIPSIWNESLDMKYLIGISVMVYGVAVNTQSSHTIDGGNPTFPNATRSSSFMFNILLYSSPILPNGQHNLTIDANNLLIDYFVVTPTGNISTPTSAVISTTFTSSTFSGSVSSSDIQSPAISAADSATTRNSIHQKAIIGAVVALAIVTIFSLFCLWLRRRRKKRDKELEPWAYATCQSFDYTSSFHTSHQSL